MDDATLELWRFLPLGYAATVLFEAPVLWLGLSPAHPPRRKLFASFWLTACTYPVVVLVLPPTVEAFWGRAGYVAVAETFAPTVECLAFCLAFPDRSAGSEELAAAPGARPARSRLRDCAAIVAANLTSFLAGGWVLDRFLLARE